MFNDSRISNNGAYTTDASGKPTPTSQRIFAEFAKLRAQCQAEGLPDKAYDGAFAFVGHIFRDHADKFDWVNDAKLTITFKDKARGLTRDNLLVAHED